ncbi:MAG TPA: periplasmic heavy metal sensor [bacterium]|nr:periplasmic heavy metal sensor [bacterium]
MKKRHMTWICIVSLVFNAAFITAIGFQVFQRRYRTEKPDVKKQPVVSMDIPPEKREKLSELRQAFFKEIDPSVRRIREEKKQLLEMFMNESVDSLRVHQKIETVAELQRVIDKKVANQLMKEKRILPSDQQDRFYRFLLSRMGGESRHSRREPSKDKKPENREPRYPFP